MFVHRLRSALLLTLSLSYACAGDEEVECFDDRTCGTGMRCDAPSPGTKGTCAPCDGQEIPYDGVDNDCNTVTRDNDLDGDGDNPPEAGGMDCDDNDPDVSSMKAEICSDAKDNDCDGDVDEVDCGDRQAPSVTFTAPAENELVSQTFTVTFTTIDDVGVVEARLFINDTELDVRPFTPPVSSQEVTVSVDSIAQQLADGPATIRVEVVDVSGKTGSGTRTIVIDNMTPPQLNLMNPSDGGVYGGQMTIEADVQDGSGVQNVEISFDGALVGTFDSAPYLVTVDTASVADGPSSVTVLATDTLGNIREETVIITVDNTAPTLQFLNPAPDTNASLLIDVELEAADVTSQIAGIWSEGFSGTATTTLRYMFNTESVPNGPYTLTASTTDAAIVDDGAGANLATAEVTIQVFNIDRGPVIVLNFQNGDAVFAETTIEASVMMGDDPVDPNSVRISVDGVDQAVTSNATLYSATYDFSFHPGPTAVIEARAADTAMRMRSTTATVTITVPPTFRVTPEKTVGNGFTSHGFDVGDVNGDSIPDVVAGGGSVQMLPGIITNGNWRPGDAEIVDFMRGADDVRLLDLDGDQDLDAVTMLRNSFYVYLNNGNLSSVPDVASTVTEYTSFSVFELGDLDGDGDQDIVAAGPNNIDFVVLLNNSNAGWTLDDSYGLVSNVTDIDIADADNDGDLDVVISRRGQTDVITTYRNLAGNGTFGSGQDSFTNIDAAEYAAVGDVTGDGYPDVVATIPVITGTNPVIGALSVLVGDPSTPGTFVETYSQIIQGKARDIILTDFDGDGNLDAVFGASNGNGAEVATNTAGNGNLDMAQAWILGRQAHRPKLVDLDGDTDLDLLVSSATDGTIGYARNLGQGDLYSAPVLPLGGNEPRGVAAGDVYGSDGESDLVVVFEGGAFGTWENQGGRFIERGLDFLALGVQPTSVEIGDLDGTGGLDVAIGSSSMVGAGSGSIRLNAGTDASGDQLYDAIEINMLRPYDVIVADVNNSGVDEAVFTFDDSSSAFEGSEVWSVTGPMTATQLRQLDEGLLPRAVAAGDLANDGNGWIDYAVANGTSNDITVSYWNGTGWDTTTYTALPGIADVAIGFVGNDNFGDLIAVGSPGLILLEGRPQYGFTQPTAFPAGNGPIRLVSADFNRDGLNDVIVLNNDDRISMLIGNPQGGFFPPVTVTAGDAPIDLVRSDFDNDGREDIAIASEDSPGIMILFSNGDSL